MDYLNLFVSILFTKIKKILTHQFKNKNQASICVNVCFVSHIIN